MKLKNMLMRTASAAVLAAAVMIPSMSAMAAEQTTVGDFTYERVTDSGTNAWVVVSYNGTDTDVRIPDSIEMDEVDQENFQAQVNAGNIVVGISPDAFADDSQIETLKLPGYLASLESDAFDSLINLKAISGAGKMNGDEGFHTDGTALYDGTTLFAFPKGFSGEYEVKDGTTDYVYRAFAGVNVDKLTLKGDVSYENDSDKNCLLFADSKIGEVVLTTDTADEKTFMGAEIGTLSGSGTVDGSLMKNGKLLYFGYNSGLDLSSVSEISSLAFQTVDLYQKHQNEIPAALKDNTVFCFYNGELAERYFMVNGKTGYCYDPGTPSERTPNPEKVGTMQDYDELVEPDTDKYKKITALLYGGVPNDGDGLFEEIFGHPYDEAAYGLNGDAAKNSVGSLVWEIMGEQVDYDSIYGVGESGFTEENVKNYIEALKSRYIDQYDSLDLKNFKLAFYYPEQPANAQRLVMINEYYRPDIEISKQDVTTKEELPGAKLTVKKGEDIIDSWTSGNTPHKMTLDDGTYTLVEESAPAGYKVAESVTFTVTDGKVEGDKVVMYDEPIEKRVLISKQDITTKKELPGATLTVKKDDQVIETWTSTDTPHLMELEDGTYTLTEDSAPDGYKVSETITFTVKDGTVEGGTVVMYDEKEEPKPTKPVETETNPTQPEQPTEPETKGPQGHYSGETPEVTPTKPERNPEVTVITPTKPEETTPEETAAKPKEDRKPIPAGDMMGTFEIIFMVLAVGISTIYVIEKRRLRAKN